MPKYSEWPKRKILVTSLRLDSENPRLTNQGSHTGQADIINYLLENEKVIDLAKTIMSQGYFINESPIVVHEGGRYIVLEGNRRVAACKVIINPDLIKSAGKRSAVKKLVQSFDVETISKAEVIISPTRKDADVMIMNRHTGGSVVEKWDKTKQDRFIYNRFKGGETIDEMASIFAMAKSDIKKALQRYNVFLEIGKLPLKDEFKKVLSEEVKFSMTNIERVYESKYGRDFLGIDFTETGKVVKKLPKDEFQKRLSDITEKVINGEINSRTLNTEKEKEKYFIDIAKSGMFDVTIKQDKKYNEDTDQHNIITTVEPQPIAKSKAKTTNNTNRLFGNNLNLISGNKRIDEIFRELKTLNLQTQINAIAVLIRSYLDMVVYQFLQRHDLIKEIIKEEGLKLKESNEKTINSLIEYLTEMGIKESKLDRIRIHKSLKQKGSISKDFIPSLKYMLEYLVKGETIPEAKLRQTLQSHLNKNGTLDKVIGHNELNLLVHNEYHHTDGQDLKSVWNKLEPLLEFMIKEIKD